jgi:hypothetical protein
LRICSWLSRFSNEHYRTQLNNCFSFITKNFLSW